MILNQHKEETPKKFSYALNQLTTWRIPFIAATDQMSLLLTSFHDTSNKNYWILSLCEISMHLLFSLCQAIRNIDRIAGAAMPKCRQRDASFLPQEWCPGKQSQTLAVFLTGPDPEKRRTCFERKISQARRNITRAFRAESWIYFLAKLNHRDETRRYGCSRNITSVRHYLRLLVKSNDKNMNVARTSTKYEHYMSTSNAIISFPKENSDRGWNINSR